MKLSEYWSDLLTTNFLLKWLVVSLSLLCGILTCALAVASSREPLIIERSCLSQVVPTKGTRHTEEEIVSFVRFVLPKRFDSDASDSKFYLTDSETSRREGEKNELAQKNIGQRVLVSSVRLSGKDAIVEMDRVLNMGGLRSAIPSVIRVGFIAIERTEANPYGLLISQVKPETTKETVK